MWKMSRPSSTPTTIDAKLSSSKIISCSHLVLRHQNQLFLNNKQHLFSGHAASFDRTNLGIGKLEQTFPWGIDFSDVFCTKVSPGRLTALGNNGNPLIKMSQTWSSLVYVKASFNYFADGDFALNSPTHNFGIKGKGKHNVPYCFPQYIPRDARTFANFPMAKSKWLF